jgi:glycosyltransferase involved in cell wall biosynthesis
VFDALEGVARANEMLAQRRSPLRFELRVAGSYLDAAGKVDFEQALRQRGAEARARQVGFLGGEEKWAALREADVFCFPTYYENESQPVNLIEAMAHGLPVVTTRWRSIPECMPVGYAGLIEPRRPDLVAEALVSVLVEDGGRFRRIFKERFTLDRHLAAMAAAVRSVGI